jgi:threonine/homoserine/homoserine lactone efflux protein
MMTLTALALFAGIYLAAVASPGPAVLALTARVLARGKQGIAGFIAGCAIGDLIWFTLAAAGLAVIAQTMHEVFLVIKYAGVAYLLYLAYKLWTAPADPSAKAPKLTADTNASMLVAGLALTLSNPKTMVFFLAILPTVVDLATLSTLGFVEIGLVIAICLPAVMMVYALVFDRARGALLDRFGMARINKACAVGLAGAAGLVATR